MRIGIAPPSRMGSRPVYRMANSRRSMVESMSIPFCYLFSFSPAAHALIEFGVFDPDKMWVFLQVFPYPWTDVEWDSVVVRRRNSAVDDLCVD